MNAEQLKQYSKATEQQVKLAKLQNDEKELNFKRNSRMKALQLAYDQLRGTENPSQESILQISDGYYNHLTQDGFLEFKEEEQKSMLLVP